MKIEMIMVSAFSNARAKDKPETLSLMDILENCAWSEWCFVRP